MVFPDSLTCRSLIKLFWLEKHFIESRLPSVFRSSKIIKFSSSQNTHLNSLYISKLIYLFECMPCKIQHVGKPETPFHIRLNNHRKNIKNPHTIKACQHFNNWNHVFQKHGEFIIIEQLNNVKNASTEVLKQRLQDRENYCIKRLKTLLSFGLNLELN